MNELKQSSRAGAAARLLLATDLGPGCDRAMDRAAQLTGEWGGELTALIVGNLLSSPERILAWAEGADEKALTEAVRQQLMRELKAAGVDAQARVVNHADKAAAIRETAQTVGADVIVCGASGRGLLERVLGSTVERLAGTAAQPLLLVRRRPAGPYRKIAVATDCSASSRQALLSAAGLFPQRELDLCHVVTPLMSGLAAPRHGGDSVDMAQTELPEFIAATQLPAGSRIKPSVQRGSVETALTNYVRRHDVELVVLGSHGRSGLLDLLIGSTAMKLLEWLPCDVLLVPDSRARGT
ncbi:universal stress protein [Herbaspirillum sp. SJZ099]|uniref:universal stress protein n=1 Tax=Herbaspirillum sp. SJZ099 TaxID=2572916 RepID=UPI0011A316F8|nr:universal stress protein [Herbaspirillum sp. SJZ099]TWC68141.1 nucleotide-binding universal stress UspA family protein [Herbaspirillum sp. SJZ099]